jgi:hypothetical protein
MRPKNKGHNYELSFSTTGSADDKKILAIDYWQSIHVIYQTIVDRSALVLLSDKDHAEEAADTAAHQRPVGPHIT